MESLTRWVLGHRKLVVLTWVVLTVAGMMTAGTASKRMDQKFTVPGREGFETNRDINRLFHGTGDSFPLLAVVSGSSDLRGQRGALRDIETKLDRANPGGRVSGYGSTGSRAFLSADGKTAFALAYPPPDKDQPFGNNPDAEKRARKAVTGSTIASSPVRLTGYDALSADSGSSSDGPGVLIEALVGGFGALIVLAFVFGSFLAVVPLLMAVPAILTSFLAVLGLTTIVDISPIVQFLIALIGLGVAIDYALIIVVRWREELAHGKDGDEAIVAAMQHAGRAVVFSGTTVAVGLLALIVLPVPFLRSVGYGGMLIPLVSVIVATTLLPVVLHSIGHKLDWPHRRTDDKASRAWTRWAGGIVRRRWAAAGLALVALIALGLAATGIRPGISDVNTIAKSGDAKTALVALEESGIGAGAIIPHEVLVRGTSPQAVAQTLDGVKGIHGAVAPGWTAGGASIVDAFPVADGSTHAASDTTDRVRAAAHAAGADVRLGGQLASNDDFTDAVYGSFPAMLVLIAFVTFVLLARAFRSILLPLKAVLLNLISVGAAWGVMTLVWQEGHGSHALFGVEATGSLDSWIPLMVFAFLYGLSMDYEVFILARMREEYDNTGSTDEAVVRGIGRTGRLVTSAALILFLAFTSMASAPDTSVRILATGLAAGILIDATIVRALLVPAIVSLFGRWNWVLPAPAARLLRVEPSTG